MIVLELEKLIEVLVNSKKEGTITKEARLLQESILDLHWLLIRRNSAGR